MQQYSDNAREKIKTYLTNFNGTDATNTEQYIHDFAKNVSDSVFSEVLAWLIANKKEVKTQVTGGSSAGVWGEEAADKSGVDFD